MKTRKAFWQHATVSLFFFGLAIAMFRSLLLSDGVIINGDFTRPARINDFLTYFYPLWSTLTSEPQTFHLSRAAFYAPFLLLSKAFNWTTKDMFTLVNIVTAVVAGISVYCLVLYVLRLQGRRGSKKCLLSALLAGIGYMWSPYILQHTDHLQFRLASYALAPVALLLLMQGVEGFKTKASGKAVILLALSGLSWSLATGDAHFIVTLAVPLIGYLVYVAFGNIGLVLHRKMHVKEALWQPMASFLILITSFAAFSAWWLAPALAAGGVDLYPNILSQEGFNAYYSRATIPNIWIFRPERTSVHPFSHCWSSVINRTGLNGLITILSGVPLLFAFVGLIRVCVALVRRRIIQSGIYFSLLLFTGIVFTAGPQLLGSVWHWLMLKAPFHQLYNWAFRTPKQYWIILLASSVLSGMVMEALFSAPWRGKFGHLGHAIKYLFGCIYVAGVLAAAWPWMTGDAGGTLRATTLPPDLQKAVTWIHDNNYGYHKVAVVPLYWGLPVSWLNGLVGGREGDMLSLPTYSTGLFRNLYYFSIWNVWRTPSLLLAGTTRSISSYLSPLGIKYLVFHYDIKGSHRVGRPYDEVTRDVETSLMGQPSIDVVFSSDLVRVYENKDEVCQVWVPNENWLSFGGLETLEALNLLRPDATTQVSLRFAAQLLPKKTDMEAIDCILVGSASDRLELAFLLADRRAIIAPFDHCFGDSPLRGWSRLSTVATITPGWQEWLYRYRMSDWSFDYGRGIVFTDTRYRPAVMKVPIEIKERDTYVVLIRTFNNKLGHELKVKFDDDVFLVNTADERNIFRWQEVGRLVLEPGKHILTLENEHGFTAVNLVALIPEDAFEIAQEEATHYLAERMLVSLIWPKLGGHSASAQALHSPTVPATLALELDAGQVWESPLEMPVSGYYRLALLGEGRFRVRVDDELVWADHTAETRWIYSDSLWLSEGVHTIRVEALGQVAFDTFYVFSWNLGNGDVVERPFGRSDSVEILEHHRINAGEHFIRVRADKPFVLALAESWNSGWIAELDDGSVIKSFPLYSVVNGFYVDRVGEYTVLLRYHPQAWLWPGAAIGASAFCGLVIFGLHTWQRQRRSLK